MHRLTSGTLRDAFPAAWGGQNNFSELEKLFFDVHGLGEAKKTTFRNSKSCFLTSAGLRKPKNNFSEFEKLFFDVRGLEEVKKQFFGARKVL